MKRASSGIPRDPAIDSTAAFLREGYRFVSNRCAHHRSDLFVTRIMLRKVVCMRGAAAAEQFYRPGRLTRRGATPRTALTLLQDRGSVQTLDGGEHRHRKDMFMTLMSKPAIRHGTALFAEEWRAAARAWPGERIILHDAAAGILTRTALRWCGLDPERHEPEHRKAELTAMIDGAGSFGLRQLRGQILRRRSERWARGLIRDIRAGREKIGEAEPAARIAAHRDPNGRLLPEAVAAVELLNLLRPIVAVGRFIVFAAHALHVHPSSAPRTWSRGDARAFAQEVRRCYPFFPLVGGRVLEPFTWRGHRFGPGDWVLLDLYGTNRDPQSWEEPEAFRPARFADWQESAFTLIPQGGGGFMSGHRCAGEWLTIELTAEAVRFLVVETRFRVPEQDLSIALDRFPTIPKSGFVMAVQEECPP